MDLKIEKWHPIQIKVKASWQEQVLESFWLIGPPVLERLEDFILKGTSWKCEMWHHRCFVSSVIAWNLYQLVCPCEAPLADQQIFVRLCLSHCCEQNITLVFRSCWELRGEQLTGLLNTNLHINNLSAWPQSFALSSVLPLVFSFPTQQSTLIWAKTTFLDSFEEENIARIANAVQCHN